MERKLAAILSADVKGYSRLMGDDEEATIQTLKTYREVLSTFIEQHRGRVVDSPGDNLLAEFASAVDAVKSAVAIQQELKARNAALEAHRQMAFRIGLNVGDVISDEGRLYGDGVNIAARLEGLADPGGICLSGTVYDQIADKLEWPCTYQGEQSVKNIAKPVRVYKVELDAETTTAPFILEQPAELPLPDKPSIVVLPFTNMSGDPEQEYFSDGLTEDLTTDLSRLPGLFVIARHSAFTYKSQAIKLQTVSRELGVQYVLEGSVRRADKRVRINTQLIDATTGRHIWSERYDQELQDIFSMQDEIVQKIVTTLNLQLTLLEQGALGNVGPRDTHRLEAYDCFLRGGALYYRFTREANRQARQMYEQAVALDPQYAKAYVWLGWTHAMDFAHNWSQEPQQSLEQAVELGQRASALDDSLPHVHELLGWLYRWTNPRQAVVEAERAIALAPNYAETHFVLANVLCNMGRGKDAIGPITKAMRLNPHYPAYYAWLLGSAYRSAGQIEKAITTLKHALTLNANFQFTYIHLAWSYVWQWTWQLGQDPQTLEQAFDAVQRAVALNDLNHKAHARLSMVYLWQKQPQQAIAEAERALALDPNDAEGHQVLADILSFVGRPEEAIKEAEQAIHLDSLNLLYLVELGHAYYLTERYEEAIVTLKKFLAHNPNILHAQLLLAVVASETGREEEARTATAEVLRINPKFSLETWKQRVPYTHATIVERQLAALRKAGLQ